jgi:hypothetical protein
LAAVSAVLFFALDFVASQAIVDSHFHSCMGNYWTHQAAPSTTIPAGSVVISDRIGTNAGGGFGSCFLSFFAGPFATGQDFLCAIRSSTALL